jgi:single-strand DNA-binding protein
VSGSVSKTILIGRLGQDPDIRTVGHKVMASFSLATSETWRDKTTNERKERTEWHRVVVFDEDLAIFAEQNLRKGMSVYLEGQNKTRKYTGKDKVERYTTEVVIPQFRGVLVSVERSGGNAPPPACDMDDYGTTTTRAAGLSTAQRFDLDDEIPF